MKDIDPMKLRGPDGPYKTPLTEYKMKAEQALNFLNHQLGSFAMDTEYAKINGFLQGYINAMRQVERYEDD